MTLKSFLYSFLIIQLQCALADPKIESLVVFILGGGEVHPRLAPKSESYRL